MHDSSYDDDFLSSVKKANTASDKIDLPPPETKFVPTVDDDSDPLAPPPSLPESKPPFGASDAEFGGDIGAAAMAGDQKAASKLFEDDDNDDW